MATKKLRAPQKKALDRRAEKDTRGSITMLAALFEIHRSLRRGAVVPPQLLEERTSKSTRQVQRLIGHLKELFGAEIIYDRSNGGYRYETEPRELSIALLEDEDLASFADAAPLLAQHRGTPFLERFARSFAKLTAQVPSSAKARIERSSQRIEVKKRAPSIIDPQRFELLEEAIREDAELVLVYHGAKSPVPSSREVEPYALYEANGKWYLFARDLGRNRVLKFVVDRIWSAGKTGRKFARPPNFSAAESLRDSFGVYQAPEDENIPPREVRLRFAAAVARSVTESIHHPSQRVEKRSDGGVELCFRLRDTLELESFVLAWGEHVEVLEPVELREKLRQRLENAARNYIKPDDPRPPASSSSL